ncbi:MAG: hypothetical protein RLZZ488_1123 [Pseudomonadota bacterium]|jgi:hypothetical protein
MNLTRMLLKIMTSVLVVPACSLLIAQPAGAAQNTISGGKKGNSKRKKSVDNEEFQASVQNIKPDNSATARENKIFGVEALLTPVSDFFLSLGAGGYWSQSPDLHLGGFLLSGARDLKSQFPSSGGLTVETAKVSAAMFGVSARYFLGNSFSAKTGFAIRTANLSLAVQDSSGNRADLSQSIFSSVLPIAIGNHWFWRSGLSVGVDWLMVSVPLSTASTLKLSSNSVGQTSLDEAAVKFQSAGDKTAKSVSLTLGLLSVGYIF